MNFVKVDPDNWEHLCLLYCLLLQRRDCENISHQRMPSFGAHAAFVRSNPYEVWYLIKVSGKWVGATYLSHRREIGIFLYGDYQGHGYGRDAVSMLMNLHPGEFYANIAPGNRASRRFFERFGFEFIQQTYHLGGKNAAQTKQTPE